MVIDNHRSKAICQVSETVATVYGFQPDCKLLYFNRLKVEQKFRGQGLATKMLKRMVELADTIKATIICDINPYGDLNYDQLYKLYKKFGFEDYQFEEYKGLVRYPNG